MELFRLQSPISRPYPWRWLTPVALFAFLLLSVLFTLINIPLSAYELSPQFTNNPNDTDTGNPWWRLIPSGFQAGGPDRDFEPYTVSVGDIVRPKGSAYNYKVTDARGWNAETNESTKITSFSYYNTPLNTSCDISSLWTGFENSSTLTGFDAKVQLGCWDPAGTPFTLEWSATENDMTSSRYNNSKRSDYMWLWTLFLDDLQDTLRDGSVEVGRVGLGACFPQCDSSYPPFNNSWADFQNQDKTPMQYGNVPIFLKDHLPCSTQKRKVSFCDRYNNDYIHRPDYLHNVIQVLYHSVRLNLGIVTPDNILGSKELFLQAIQFDEDDNQFWTQQIIDHINGKSIASKLDFQISEENLAKSYAIEHTIPFPYLKNVWHPKPIGSAIISVYASTFTIIALLWTVFHLIAGCFLDRKDSLSLAEERIAALEAQLAHDVEARLLNLEEVRNTPSPPICDPQGEF
ncbi:hypothetical protein CYLTODRAFT_419078 [Cylindrobasidium torrendii FP15055 ss-10]|uniref:Uncharacterized protein n=1 Tax=Cylindrobasidium torrendii FP15055 ss-10 TaxID=1314674 RepID=A0A0D7BM10_9AGAR|nr:hypothetical protein CYLTODRAFT_419078 [Cylindrobasidium torrendii FP15055 ss-10]